LAAGRGDLLDDLPRLEVEHVGDDDLRALAGEDDGFALAHATGAAGDERDLSRKSHVPLLSVRTLGPSKRDAARVDAPRPPSIAESPYRVHCGAPRRDRAGHAPPHERGPPPRAA